MTLRILVDSSTQPGAFQWFGPIDAANLSEWCSGRRIQPPMDLFELLERTGGGDFFESETILGPIGGRDTGDESDGANGWHRQRGLPEDLWLFHVGITLSALRRTDNRYVTLSRAYIMEAEYSTLDDWYAPIREEFAERYGLAP